MNNAVSPGIPTSGLPFWLNQTSTAELAKSRSLVAKLAQNGTSTLKYCTWPGPTTFVLGLLSIKSTGSGIGVSNNIDNAQLRSVGGPGQVQYFRWVYLFWASFAETNDLLFASSAVDGIFSTRMASRWLVSRVIPHCSRLRVGGPPPFAPLEAARPHRCYPRGAPIWLSPTLRATGR